MLATLLINILSLVFPLTLLQIYDRIIPNEAITTLILLCTGVGVSLLFIAVLKIARAYIGAWADAKFEHITGCRAFTSLLRSDLQEYEKVGSGIHLKRLSSLGNLRGFYAGQAIIALIDTPFVIIYLLLFVVIAGWLVLVPMLMLLIFFLVTASNSKKIKAILKSRQDQDDRRLNFIIETISKIHTIKSNTMEAQMLRRYERLQKTASLNDYKVSLKGVFSISEGLTLSQLTIILVVAVGSIFVMKGNLTVGGLAACTLLAGRCLQPINGLISVWNRLQSISLAQEELQKTLEIKAEEEDNLPAVSKVLGDVEFDNVTFSYNDTKPYLISNLNLKIKKGESVAFTGKGLSGKSTILLLLLGMLTPSKGKVLIDGKNIQNIHKDSLRKLIGYLPQNAVLFQGSIMDNLTMFRSEEYYAQAIEVAEKVGLSKIIEHLPDGYDTQVGNQAIETLPRGIKQRVAIARALLHNPSIILFDEANTALDMSSDAMLKELLIELSKSATMIIISHRPSIINIAQRQYSLTEGELRVLE